MIASSYVDVPHCGPRAVRLPTNKESEQPYHAMVMGIAGGILTRAVRNRPNRTWVEARNRVEESKSQ
jgi:hypothetical protein